MVDYLEITPSGQRPSRLEFHLERETLTWDDCLVGRVNLTAGNDGLRLASLRVAPEPLGAADRYATRAFQAYWEAVRVAPRKREWLDFRLQIPPGCGAGTGGALLVEALTYTAELAVLRVPIRVVPPGVYVKIGEWIARRAGLVVRGVWQGEVETCLLLDAPAGHGFLNRIELGFARDRYGIRVGLMVSPKRRGVERLRWLVRYRPGTAFELEVDPDRLDDSLPALDAALRPFLGAIRDLPLPASAPAGAERSLLPIVSDPPQPDERTLPRPASGLPKSES